MHATPHLKIQPDESIRSYVLRALTIKSGDKSVASIRRYKNFVRFLKHELVEIAAHLGWYGCYGFNRLICLHTPFAANYVVKNSQDVSYSRRHYPFSIYTHLEKTVNYCPECAKEDYLSLGFSYWRRAYSVLGDETVCHKHNVLLITDCPFCDLSLSDRKHGLDVMWNGCNGRYLWEVTSVLNKNSASLRRAQFNHALCTSTLHISDAAALNAVRRKIKSSMPEGVTSWHDIYWLDKDLESIAGLIHAQSTSNDAAHLDHSLKLINEQIFSQYDDFDEFSRDLGENGFLRSVEEGWGIYLAMGNESVWYVSEDYRKGIAEFYSPYHCEKSLRIYSHFGFRKVDAKFDGECCIQKKNKTKLVGKRCDTPLPAVPRLSPAKIQRMYE